MRQHYTIGEKYAKALYRTLSGVKAKEKTAAELHILAQAITAPEHIRFFNDPAVSRVKKKDALTHIITASGASERLAAFFALLAENKRLNASQAIADRFSALLREEKNVVEVTAEFAVKPSAAALKKITAGIQDALGKKIILQHSVSKKLLGGMRLYIGSGLFDYSTDTRLKKLAAYCKSGRA